MKKWFVLLFLIPVFSLPAQEFHRYKIKSGKITYQIVRYSIHTEIHIDSDGNQQQKAELIPYVYQSQEYYWDDFGNVAHAVTYQVAAPNGKPLQEKEKLFEQLWKGNHRFYYKKGEVNDDPYYLREECLENKKLFEVDGWFKILNPKAELLEKERVLGKEGSRYKVDEYSETVLWKGLVLKDISYFTNGKGIRKGKESVKTAVKIQIPFKASSDFFDPQWLRKYVSEINNK
ncbi:MAG: hypothetical protein JXR65_06635 [Bacteroidales bacterium]|nr:hypothetical protein [Bacteroidales bacterium]